MIKMVVKNVLCLILYIYVTIYDLLFITIILDEDEIETIYPNDNLCPICFENKINSCCIPCGKRNI
jgi:hypothetical protein